MVKSLNRFDGFRDILIYYMTHYDLKDTVNIEELSYDLIRYLQILDYSQEEINDGLLFKFKFDKNRDFVQVIPENLISALWFSNIYPERLPLPHQLIASVGGTVYELKNKKLITHETK